MSRIRVAAMIGAAFLVTGHLAAAGKGAAEGTASSLTRSLDKAARSVAAEAEKFAADVTGKKPQRNSPSRKGSSADTAASADAGKAGTTDGTAQYSSSPTQTQPQTLTETPVTGETAAHDKDKPTGTWPKTLEDAKAEAQKNDKPPPEWSAEDIAEAKLRCEALLKTIDAVVVPEPALREGADGECGAPAPIRLVSIGKNPEVAISPPALVTCELAVALHTWLKKDLQPLAKAYLGAEIIKIENMSDYSCRKAYARVGNKLSEHGKANALDIRGFVTAKAQTAYVLDEWGLTERDIAAQIAAAKLEAERLAAEKAAQDKAIAEKASKDGKGPADAAVAATPEAGRESGAKAKVLSGLPGVTVVPPVTRPGLYPPGGTGTGLGFSPPSQLGGPKPKDVVEAKSKAASDAAAKPRKPSDARGDKSRAGPRQDVPVLATAPATPAEQRGRKSSFLREAHVRACRIFGTVLGPEANEAHRNHFHVDMAERRHGSFCE